ncbi:hypothetical protein TELCIR_24372 [Teladorsagia circumcincta]|uniref:C-type lectin domain-containing protein n=1 Tax=Teladorsagia circumcincta TaxID=45464 RepID=A0A2G9T8H9_TELCI|nr:hypothetical protein TELCIR_24372 [Teladorsagia circumcincta]
MALTVTRLCSFSNAENPDVLMASNSDQVEKVRPVFGGTAVKDGWVIWPKRELMYKVFNQKATWDEAEQTCKSNGGHLASIESAEENDFIYGEQPVIMCEKSHAHEVG